MVLCLSAWCWGCGRYGALHMRRWALFAGVARQRAARIEPGLQPVSAKLTAFIVMAGVLGAYSGALLALMLRGAYADNLGWQHAGDALLMTVLGGVHHFLGPLWGAIRFRDSGGKLSTYTENWWLIFAPIILVFALGSPEGIQGLAQRLLGRRHWTLTRRGIPPRPRVVVPWGEPAYGGGSRQADLNDSKAEQAIWLVGDGAGSGSGRSPVPVA